MTTIERLVWLCAAIVAVVLVAVLASCAAADKLLPAIGKTREVTRSTCAEIEAADRVAGVLLDDAGVP